MIPTSVTNSPPAGTTGAVLLGISNNSTTPNVYQNQSTSVIIGLASLILEGRPIADDEYQQTTLSNSKQQRQTAATTFTTDSLLREHTDLANSFSSNSGFLDATASTSASSNTLRCAEPTSASGCVINITTNPYVLSGGVGAATPLIYTTSSTSAMSTAASTTTHNSNSHNSAYIESSYLAHGPSSSSTTAFAESTTHQRWRQKLCQLRQISPAAQSITNEPELVALAINDQHNAERTGSDFEIVRRVMLNRANMHHASSATSAASSPGSGSGSENILHSLQSLATTCLRGGGNSSVDVSVRRETPSPLSLHIPQLSPPIPLRFSAAHSRFSDNPNVSILPAIAMSLSCSTPFGTKKAAVSSIATPSAASTTTSRPQHGPHCDQFLRKMGLAKGEAADAEEHICDMSYVNITCSRWRAFCMKIEAIVSRNEPVCIEVYLGPVGHKILLEQWIITWKEKMPPPTMTLPSLCSAIRSQLYFSQIVAWCDLLRKSDKSIYDSGRIIFSNAMCTVAGDLVMPSSLSSSPGTVIHNSSTRRPRLNIFYRIKQYDATASFNSKPNVHNFPNVNIADNISISVCLKSLPRINGGLPKIVNAAIPTPCNNSNQTQPQQNYCGIASSPSSSSSLSPPMRDLTERFPTCSASTPTSGGGGLCAATPSVGFSARTTLESTTPRTTMELTTPRTTMELTTPRTNWRAMQQANKQALHTATHNNNYKTTSNNNNKINSNASFNCDKKNNFVDVELKFKHASHNEDMGYDEGDNYTIIGSMNTLQTHREKQLQKYRKRMLKRDKKRDRKSLEPLSTLCHSRNESRSSNSSCASATTTSSNNTVQPMDECHEEEVNNDDDDDEDECVHGTKSAVVANHARITMISTGTQTLNMDFNCCQQCGREKLLVCLNCSGGSHSSREYDDFNDDIHEVDDSSTDMDELNESSCSLSSSDLISVPRNKAELLLQAIQRTPKNKKKIEKQLTANSSSNEHNPKNDLKIATTTTTTIIPTAMQQQQQQNNNHVGHKVITITGSNCQVCKRQKTQHIYSNGSVNSSQRAALICSPEVDNVGHTENGVVPGIELNLNAEKDKRNNVYTESNDCNVENFVVASTKLTPQIDRCRIMDSNNTETALNAVNDASDIKTLPGRCITPPTTTTMDNVESNASAQFKTPTMSATQMQQQQAQQRDDCAQQLKKANKPNILRISCAYANNKTTSCINGNNCAGHTDVTPTHYNPFMLRKTLPKVNLTPIFCNATTTGLAGTHSAPIPINCNGAAAAEMTFSFELSTLNQTQSQSAVNAVAVDSNIPVQKSYSAPTLPNSLSLSPRFAKQASFYKRRSRHLSDRSDRSSLGSDEQLSDEDFDIGMASPSATSPMKCRSRIMALFGRRSLLGNLEESLLQKRILPKMEVSGFKVLLGASGGFCPTQLTIPAAAYFYELRGETMSTPYLCEIRLPRKGYSVPRTGTVQATLLNPMGTVVRMFVIPYDMRDMPPLHRTFIRQRILAEDTKVSNCDDQSKTTTHTSNNGLGHFINAEQMKRLRYSIHLRFQTSRSGRLSLHSDIRLLISRRTDCDTAAAHAKGVLEAPNELVTETTEPSEPRYSARQENPSKI